ncbi:hypothetical protein [Paenibacillus sp. D9]|uniref:hypothetical protein n=1 Tax=Paenibacillus sp. D9 TaxID=665792 RepID=UPI000AEAF8A3|nr:hypothetical protein [Paenibacillus sp. D9]
MYWTLFNDKGMSLPEIDGMDILFYFRMLRHGTSGGSRQQQITPIDQVGFL